MSDLAQTSKLKRGLGIDVLTAARRRIALVFDRFPKVCVSFSAGKDSTVMLHLMAAEARKRRRRFGLLFIDLEAQYAATINHALACFEMYADVADPIWVALPLNLRNAVSQFEPQWLCFDPERKDEWVRQPPLIAITNETHFSFFRRGMEFEEFVEEFALWYADGELTACLVGIRSDESLNRFRTLVMQKRTFDGIRWTTWKGAHVYNAYPIYDWRVEDIWTFGAQASAAQNPIYDLMTKAGVPPSLQRICQPYGDDQRRGLWLFHLLEPATWTRVVARVSGANGGALYAQETGNILGVGSVTKPTGHTWKSYSQLLLDTMPPSAKLHFENKIAVFLKWWMDRGYAGGIPDEAPRDEEAARKAPSWRRICRAILRNDYWCKSLSFSQHESRSYESWKAVMKKRRAKWKII